eukprot:TRINITY_DN15057_c0_g2_i1.p1 TRINITY_DN15057_c0_g2~~TRINITY_DN15057_c0_g2_i1.p1  ORF type:complete len:449 (+),score=82.99 TRINITY_DN15057_c0_g2_i1:110-1456(+)
MASTGHASGGGGDAGGLEPVDRSDMLVAYTEHLAQSVKTMGEQVNDVESRQERFDRRLAELQALVQGIQEEQAAAIYTSPKSTSIVPHQGANANAGPGSGPSRSNGNAAKHGAVGARPPRSNSGGYGPSSPLAGLGDLVVISSRASGNTGACAEAGGFVGGENADVSDLYARVVALERNQKTVAVGVHRALQAALTTRHEQKTQQQDDDWQRCLDGLNRPNAELEHEWSSRFNEQDQRMDSRMERLIHMVDTLADNVLRLDNEANSRCSGSPNPSLEDSTTKHLALARDSALGDLRAQVEEMESKLMYLFSAQQSMPVALPPSSPTAPSRANADNADEGILASIARIEQRIENREGDTEEQRLQLRHVGKQLTDAVQRFDRLERQCNEHFPRIEEHDIKINLCQKKIARCQGLLDELHGELPAAPRTPTGHGVDRQHDNHSPMAVAGE